MRRIYRLVESNDDDDDDDDICYEDRRGLLF